jgi:hypothetical protein
MMIHGRCGTLAQLQSYVSGAVSRGPWLRSSMAPHVVVARLSSSSTAKPFRASSNAATLGLSNLAYIGL